MDQHEIISIAVRIIIRLPFADLLFWHVVTPNNEKKRVYWLVMPLIFSSRIREAREMNAQNGLLFRRLKPGNPFSRNRHCGCV